MKHHSFQSLKNMFFFIVSLKNDFDMYSFSIELLQVHMPFDLFPRDPTFQLATSRNKINK